MRLKIKALGGEPGWWRRVLFLVVLVWAGVGLAARAAQVPPPSAAPAMGDMNSAGWLARTIGHLEAEAMSDVSMLPDTPSALEREWRSFDRDGSASGALANLGWGAGGDNIAVIG